MTLAAVVTLRDVRKAFPGIIANDGLDFDVYAGEVHAVLGENGAGKTTLMNILAGLYQPDAGTIRLDGHPIRLRSPRDASRHGIGMVHQTFRLVPSMTVAENILLGLGPERGFADGRGRPAVGWRVRLADHLTPLARIASQFGLAIDVGALVSELSVGEQQRVEIVRMLYRGVRILVLDEPTATLTPRESNDLLKTLRLMAQEGRSIVFVSHKLDEVMAVADRVSVMRRGRRVTTVAVNKTTPRELAAAMVGGAWPDTHPVVLMQASNRAPLLVCEHLSVLSDHQRPAVRDLTLAVHAGEIVGIAGVAGNGQRELVEALVGLRPVHGGSIRLDGRDVTGAATLARIRVGLRYLPADRIGVGAAPNLSVAENLVLKRFRERAFGSWWCQDRRALRSHARALMDEFMVTGGEPRTPVRLLSGGNLQRVLLARELTLPGCVIAAESPSRGLDVAGSRFVHERLAVEARRHRAVLVVSEDADELLGLCDRIAVMSAGRLVSVMRRDTASHERLGLLMAGRLPG